jgi:hypothetical protein
MVQHDINVHPVINRGGIKKCEIICGKKELFLE